MQLRQTRDILQQTDAEDVAGVRSALRCARQVCCFGSGREGLALKAFATRLHQMNVSVSLLLPSVMLACRHLEICSAMALAT